MKKIALSIAMLLAILGGTLLFKNSDAPSENAQSIMMVDNFCSGPAYKYRLRFQHSSKYMQVSNNGTSAGTNIEQWSQSNSNSQLFYFQHVEGNTYRIRSSQSGKPIGIAGGSTSNAANVELQNQSNSAAQYFIFEKNSNGSYHIKNTNSNQALNVSGVSQNNGANVLQWPAGTGTNDNIYLELASGNCSAMQCEAKVGSGAWQNLSDCSVSAPSGSSVLLSMNPNDININWTLPDGTTSTGTNLNLTNVSSANKGWYYGEMNINGSLTGKAIYLNVTGGTDVGMLSQYDPGKAVSAVIMHNNYLFVPMGADHGGGQGAGAFAFYNISDPSNISPVFSSLDYPDKYHNSSNINYAGDLAEIHSLPVIKNGTHMVLSERRNGSAGFSILNVSNFPSTQPEVVSRYSFPGVTSPSNYDGYSFSLACLGSDYVIAPTGANGLFIIDIKDVQNPTLVKHMTQSELGNIVLRSAVVMGDVLILTPGAVGVSQPFVFLDITDITNPSIISTTGNIPIGYQPFVYGSEIFGAADGNIVGYDFSDPANITSKVYNTVAATHLNKPEYGFGQDGHIFIGHYPGLTKWDLSASTTAGPVVKLEPINPAADDYAFLTPVGNLAIIASDHNHPNKLNIGRHKAGTDTTPPSAEYTRPSNNKTNVNTKSAIGINFSDFVDALTLNTQNIEVKNMSNNTTLSGSFSQMFGVVNFVPSAPLAANTTYRVTLKANGIKDWRGNAIPSDTIITTFSTGAQIVTSQPFTINPTVPTATGTNAQLSITHADNVQYTWNFGDGSAQVTTGSHSVSHQYTTAGNYTVTVTAQYPNNETQTKSTVQVVHKPLLSTAPLNSSSIIYDAVNSKVWNVNPDNNSIAAVSTTTNARVHEVAVGNSPQTLALVNADIWVTNRKDASISIVSGSSGTVSQTISLPYASQPYGIVYDQAKSKVYVSLEAKGQVVAIDVNTKQISNTLSVAPRNKNLALQPSTGMLYVTQFISPSDAGKLYAINTNNFTIQHSINLAIDTTPDGLFNGRGLPNYLGAIGISPDGSQAFIPSKKDNIQRGLKRDGLALTFDHTVRSMGASINLSTHQESMNQRIDFDNSDFATSATYNKYGNKVLVTTSGSSTVHVVDAYSGASEGGFNSGGLAPRGIVMSPDGNRLYVHNFMERNITIFDATVCVINCGNVNLLASVSTVTTEALTAQVLQGKKLFYNSSDTRLAQDSYMSCASCHLDGSHDGRVWDMTALGEGFRNTIDLRGKSTAHGRFHWTSNFDEVQDFENQIRNLNNGSGLLTDAQFQNTQFPLGTPKAGLSTDLDALAAYVNSLTTSPKSPYKQSNGSLTPAAQAGKLVFENLQCYNCHGGSNFTNSSEQLLIDVGTITANSGKRLGQTLHGLDVPTLKGLWDSGPYLHDGSAATLNDVLTTKNPDGKHSNVSNLSSTQLSNLVEYLKQIDGDEPSATAAGLMAAIATPTAGQQVTINTSVALSVNTNVSNIQKIEYFINNNLVGTANSAPFTYNYSATTTGVKYVMAKVHYGAGTTVLTKTSNFEVFTTIPHCTDGVQNNGETGVDCGGPDCSPCPTCNDGVQNGSETGVDCGGPDCPSCPCASGDSDGDGVCDAEDKDDDNDGILDDMECSTANIQSNFSNGNGGGTHTFTRALTDSILIDINSLDNSVDLKINGTSIDKIFQLERYWFNSSNEVMIKFASGDYISPWVANSNGLPRLRIIINKSGQISLLGTRNTNSTSLETVIRESSTPLLSITYGASTTVQIINPNISGYDSMAGQIKMTGSCDTDGDGIHNRLDLDSDNDGCIDALEGGKTIQHAQLVNANSNLSVGTGSSAAAKNLGTTVNASGIPTIVGNGQGVGTAYNASTQQSDCQVPDTESPSIPINLSASNITHNSFTVSWNAASDNIGVTGYKVYRDGQLVTTVNSLSANMTGLAESTTYQIKVAARDAAGNESAQSQALSVTTTEAPSCTNIKVEIKTDNYGSETSWTLKNASNQTVMSGSGYASNNTYTVQECLPQGCYTFKINDSYGDGICCSWGSGHYKIFVNGNLSTQGGSFGSSETKQVCNNTQSLEEDAPDAIAAVRTVEDIAIYPIPAVDMIMIKGAPNSPYHIYNINGQIIAEGIVTKDPIRIHNYVSGTYIVRIEMKDGNKKSLVFVKE